jgi:hypothetical protein
MGKKEAGGLESEPKCYRFWTDLAFFTNITDFQSQITLFT